MDLGMVGLDGLVGTTTTSSHTAAAAATCLPSSLASDPETKQKWYGSGFLKQESSGVSEDDWRSLKVAKTEEDFSASKAMLLQHRASLMRSNTSLVSDGQQMLSFSSPNSQTVTLPNFYHFPASTCGRNTGYGSGGLNVSSMHGVIAEVRGPFTPSQWMELEHQALIYKYITANVPIPSNLLIPIRKALDSAGFSGFSGGLLGPTTLGWGAFRYGFSNSTDPEPGRCRRTDGKKWRCSRDAVPDQKYCERHMNRGRHRSRKPVEGQTGHSVSGPTTAGKPVPVATSVSAAVVPGGGASSSLGLAPQSQLKNLQHSAPNYCAPTSQIDRMFLNKENLGERAQDSTDLSMLSPTIALKENQFAVPKPQNVYQDSSRGEFGRVYSDSLLNPLHKRSYGSSQDHLKEESQYSVHQFMDDWPKSQSNRSAISWPGIDMQADRTQLSISTPVAVTSSTSSPDREKLVLSPLRLSRELDMGLGVGSVGNEPNQRQANWIPISWESSMGGPLGEVLHSGAGDCKSSSALNLMTGGWDSSPRLASSPTGVLQKMAFGSLSNSSAGSSPRAGSHKTLLEGAFH